MRLDEQGANALCEVRSDPAGPRPSTPARSQLRQPSGGILTSETLQEKMNKMQELVDEQTASVRRYEAQLPKINSTFEDIMG